jgi:hypothetical protein
VKARHLAAARTQWAQLLRGFEQAQDKAA